MARKKKGNPVHGVLVLFKEEGQSSAQAVSRVKRLFNAQKSGHGGTLDPLACGVLPIAFGEATKALPYVLNADKHYKFTLKFGAETQTDDREGDFTLTSDKRPTEQELKDVLEGFKGKIQQVPPAFSAIKVDGKRAYDLAREGQEVELEAREIEILALELLEFSPEQATLRVSATKGTYVRSLARDIGRALGCYAYVSYLEREKAGKFTKNQSISLKDLEIAQEKGHILESLLISVSDVLDDIPAYQVTEAEASKLKQGQPLKLNVAQGDYRALYQNQLLSLIEVATDATVKIKRNFNLDIEEKS